MNQFLVDKDISYSYADLLSSINADTSYCPYLKTANLYQFFQNLLKALSNNQPLVLLDSDLNEEEISGINSNDINRLIELPTFEFETIDLLIDAVQNSTSEITIFTSGTTGQPKKVIHTVATLTRSVRLGEKYWNQIWGYAYNPTHMAGLQVFFQAFENKNLLVNIFNTTRNDVYAAIEKWQITHISATPTFYRLLLPVEQSYPSIQRITFGGEKSDQHLYDSVSKVFPSAKLTNVYASTEAGSLFAAKGDCFQLPLSLKDKFRVQDNELLIHKSLLGYSESFQFEGDYYHSGDLIEWVDETNGLFRFCSRKNELINVGGYKVNPGETENLITSIPGVKQALVYGKANSVLGNILCADVQLEEDVNLTELEIRNILKDYLQDFKIPRRIKFVDNFSITRTGKLKRS